MLPRPSVRAKELRIALICYGGVSLAVYMHGITRELWKLLRASEARRSGHTLEGDSEPVWQAFLDSIAETVDLTVVCDILSGASAGGINAIMLGRAIADGLDMEPLREMWLERADVEHMLDPEARPGRAMRMAQFYKQPFAWAATHLSESLPSVDDPKVRAEVMMKLSGFVRSRWFQPPFSGVGLTMVLYDAMQAMEASPPGPPLLPPGIGLDLAVTTTDYHGMTARLPIHSPPYVMEKEHRRIFAFQAAARRDWPEATPARRLGDLPGLTFAARATSCFPGAFPAAHIGEMDDLLRKRGEAWPGREDFVTMHLAGDRAPEDIRLIDGSILNNAPFGPALEAIRLRPSHHDVDRRFVYIDPTPGIFDEDESPDRRPPGFFTTILRALADIPREQPIRDSLEAISATSARIRRFGEVIEGMTPAVDAAIRRAVGHRFFIFNLSPDRLARGRSRIQSVAAREAGFAFAGYAQLKLRIVLETAAELLIQASGGPMGQAERAEIQHLLVAAARARGAFDHDAATGRDAPASPYVAMLRGLDIGFRIRRLRFVLRWLNQTLAGLTVGVEPADRDLIEQIKTGLHTVLAPFVTRQSHAGATRPDMVAAAAQSLLETPDIGSASDALDALASSLDLSSLDGEADRIIVGAVENPQLSRNVREGLLRAFLGFPFYDIAILPLMPEESSDSFLELRVDRISPQDAQMLRTGGMRATLKGWQLNNFAAFFSRAYRENDYLWGRLHAAERFADIVLSSARGSGATDMDASAWKKKLFMAILDSERAHLSEIQPLIDELVEQVSGETDS
ncbi:MAG: patatin-like protein [Sphingomonadaceae bacterium]